jgi:hypothetical protein
MLKSYICYQKIARNQQLVKVSKLFNQIWLKLYAIKSQF